MSEQQSSAPDREATVKVGDHFVRFGAPEHWKAFARRNADFMEVQGAIHDALNRVFIRDMSAQGKPSDVVYALGRVWSEDYLEVLLLCGNGYGFAALKVLRGMFERLVTAKFLHLHPEETGNYLDYYWINEYRLMQAVERTMKPGVIPAERKRRAEERYEIVRQLYTIPDCKKCGTTRVHHTWHRLDVVSMAHKVGLQDLIVSCYYVPTHHIHATVHGIVARTKSTDAGHLVFDGGAQPEEADRSILSAHALILYVLELQKDQFQLSSFEPTYAKLVEDFERCWANRLIANKPPAPGQSSATS
jgi:hypothetical protein